MSWTKGANAYVESADLTEGEGGFEGILGASEDLARIYFVDTEDACRRGRRKTSRTSTRGMKGSSRSSAC